MNFGVSDGIILVNIDPLELVRGICLRCFGEVYQEKLYKYLRVFLNRLTEDEDFKGGPLNRQVQD